MKIVISGTAATALSVVVVVALLAGTGYMLWQLYVPKTGYTVAAGQSPEANSLNIFQGRITNMKVMPGRIGGVTTYDANCIDAGSRMTECDAGIRTTEFGELNFHYRHNMATQPCLHMFGAEKVIVEILDSDGNARITRTIDVGSMGMMH